MQVFLMMQQFNGWLDRHNRRSGPVRLDLVQRDHVSVTIQHFESQHKHLGHGTRVLTRLCKLADRHGVLVHLFPMSFADLGAAPGGLRLDDLIAWYECFGFRRDPDGDRIMVRAPRKGTAYGQSPTRQLAGDPAALARGRRTANAPRSRGACGQRLSR